MEHSVTMGLRGSVAELRHAREVTLEDLADRLAAVERDVARVLAQGESFLAVAIAFMAQHGDPTHVDVERAAQIRGISVHAMRRRIAAGKYTLETIPGTRETGIPIEQLYSDWMELAAVRTAMERVKREAATVTERVGDDRG
jgi:hypothetical protein